MPSALTPTPNPSSFSSTTSPLNTTNPLSLPKSQPSSFVPYQSNPNNLLSVQHILQVLHDNLFYRHMVKLHLMESPLEVQTPPSSSLSSSTFTTNTIATSAYTSSSASSTTNYGSSYETVINLVNNRPT